MQIMQKSNLELRPQAEDVDVLTREEYENYLRQEAEDQEPEVAQHPAQTGTLDHQQITHGQHNMGVVVQNNTTTSNGSTAASENQNQLYNNREDAACGSTLPAQGTVGNNGVAEDHQRANCGTAPLSVTTTQQYNYHTNNSQQSSSSSNDSHKNPVMSNSTGGGDRIVTPLDPVVAPWGVDPRAAQNTATNHAGDSSIGRAAMAQQADLGASWVEQQGTNPYNTEGSTYTNGNGWEEMHQQQQTPWPEAESSSSAPEQVAQESRSAHENVNRCWEQVQQQQATVEQQQWTITSTAVHLTGGGDHAARGDEQSGDALSQTQPPPPPDRTESMDQSLVENPGAQMNSAVARMYSNPYNSYPIVELPSYNHFP